MDLLTFISQIINSLVWPAVAIGIVWIFRKPLALVLNKIESLRVLGILIGLRKETEKIGEEIEKIIPIQEPRPATKEEQQIELERDEFDEIYLRLEKSPALAINLAWSKLEIEAILVLKQYFQEQGKVSINSYSILQGLKEKNILNENQLELFNRLRQLKNNAVHHMRSPVPEEIALSYIESAKKMFSYLRNINT